MLGLIIAILFIMWLAGLAFSIGGVLIHILLVIALVVLLVRALKGRSPV